jgi:hypothetical protein
MEAAKYVYPAFLDTLAEKNKEYFLNNYIYVRKDEKNKALETWDVYEKETSEKNSTLKIFSNRTESILSNGDSVKRFFY